MPPKRERERYNAKGRQSTAGGSTHKKKRSNSVKRQNQEDDSNVEIITQEDKESREELRRQRQQLLEANSESHDGPISSKKRKRLDNYIANKLKKENHVALIAKLSESSRQVTDRSGLLSASTLGTGKALSGNERLEKSSRKKDREADKRREARGKGKKGLAGKMQGKLKRQQEEDREDEDLDESYSEDDDDDEGPDKVQKNDAEDKEAGEEEVDERQAKIQAALARFSKPSSTDSSSNSVTSSNNTVLGSALARGPDGQPILPVMRKKKNKKKNKQKQKGRDPGSGTSWGRLSKGASKEEVGNSDSDFDSSASENDEAESPVTLEVSDSCPKDGEAEIMDVDGNFEEVSSNEDEVLSHEEYHSGASSLGEYPDEGDVTDEDEEAVFMEAMRLRGLSKEQNTAASTSNNKTEAEKDEKTVEHEVREGSLPWEGFGSEGGEEMEVDQTIELEDDGEKEHASGEEEFEVGDDDEDAVDDRDDDGEEEDEEDEDEDEEDEDEDEEDEDEDEEGERSRRKGIAKTEKSSGFKDWARSALGMGDEHKSKASSHYVEESHDYVLEPIEGKKQRVGDLGPQDGIARGPLGDSNPTSTSSQTPFAKFYYAQQAKASADSNIVKNVYVPRTEEQKESRLKLPVVGEEESVTRTILENVVTVICGETGSGKTTQVPQFLYEKGFGDKQSDNPGMIGITQPRRVAALSMAARVASELSLPRTKVSHQIRYDATISNETAVKFMTDGVLLRELATDFLLERYSAIVIDEAHERSVNTDVLIGVLSRVVKLRADRWMNHNEAQASESSRGKRKANTTRPRPLRLIIMSATLRVSDFTSNTTLFPIPPPVVSIDARQHPVTVHFNRKTSHDYLTEATKKVSKIHARLPPGGILVFLTGQQEISTVCRRLESRYGKKAIEKRKRDQAKAAERRQNRITSRDDRDEDEDEDAEEEQNREDSMKLKVSFSAKEGDVEAEDMDLGVKDEEDDLAQDVDDGAEEDVDEEALDSEEEGANLKTHDADLPDEFKDDSDTPLHILPLYSLLPSDKQLRVFKDPPADTRLVVVATNVAETSLTIPNIRYVVDCGRSKEKTYDIQSGLQSFDVSWISKASANQRAGRAGRTGPGHCYRLYSSAVFEDHFREFSNPEILRTPVDGLVLSMKSMNIDNVINFPFPTPPDRYAIRKAEKLLENLGALESVKTKNANGVSVEALKITEIGSNMSLFPVAPRFGKLLAQGDQHGCMPYVVTLVAALSVGDPFIREQVLSDDGQGEGDEGDEEAEVLPEEMRHLKNRDEIKKEQKKAKRKRYFNAMQRFSALGSGMSDTFRLLSAVGAYEYEKGGVSFCANNFLRPKAMEEIHKLRAQLSSLILSISPQISPTLASPLLSPPSEVQLKVLRQLISASFIDQVAVRADLVSSDPSILTSGGQNGAFRKGSKMSSTRGIPYLTSGTGDKVAFIHPSSSFFHDKPPEWIIFSELQRSSTSRSIDKGEGEGEGELPELQTKIWLKTVTRINPAWIVSLGRNLCSFSKPAEIPSSKIISSNSSTSSLAAQIRANRAAFSASSDSKKNTSEREVYLTPTYNPGKSSISPLGWELPPVKAKQELISGRWQTLMD